MTAKYLDIDYLGYNTLQLNNIDMSREHSSSYNIAIEIKGIVDSSVQQELQNLVLFVADGKPWPRTVNRFRKNILSSEAFIQATSLGSALQANFFLDSLLSHDVLELESGPTSSATYQYLVMEENDVLRVAALAIVRNRLEQEAGDISLRSVVDTTKKLLGENHTLSAFINTPSEGFELIENSLLEEYLMDVDEHFRTRRFPTSRTSIMSSEWVLEALEISKEDGWNFFRNIHKWNIVRGIQVERAKPIGSTTVTESFTRDEMRAIAALIWVAKQKLGNSLQRLHNPSASLLHNIVMDTKAELGESYLSKLLHTETLETYGLRIRR